MAQKRIGINMRIETQAERERQTKRSSLRVINALKASL